MSLLAIVGRPNVGKSTLFNRLVGMRQAIVDETAGVTRDRHYGRCEWCGTEFSVVDTGGYTSNSDDIFEEEIRKQVVLAIEEAHVVLFMVEAGTGITDYDEEIADILRRSGKPVILAVNKIDSGEKMYDAFQFYSLGLGEVYSISAANGGGTGDLLDAIVKELPAEDPDTDEHPELPHFTIVGKPNVGKSSLTNALLGKERNIVTPIAGTTRDTIEALANIGGVTYRFVDTAGLHSTSDALERMGIERTVAALQKALIVLWLTDDATTKFEDDIVGFEPTVGQKVYRVLTKCDLKLNGDNPAPSKYPTIAISAKSGEGMSQLSECLQQAADATTAYAGDVIVSNCRHYEALRQAADALQQSLQGLDSNRPTDLLSEDIRQVVYHIGTITGEITSDDILKTIFSTFCIGK